MALPNQFNSTVPIGSNAPSVLDDRIRDLALAIVDVFGVADQTAISNAIAEINATGLKNIRFQNAAAYPAVTGYLQRNGADINWYDGTNVKSLLKDSEYVATVGGTPDVITLTPSPALSAYVAGQTFKFIASGANTTNVTVNISGLGAKAITKNGTSALIAGDIPSGAMLHITYDGTRFVITTTAVANAILSVIVTSKGDLITATGSATPVRKGVGSDGSLLIPQTSQSDGLKWLAPGTDGTVLAADSNQTDKIRYVNVGLPNFRGVVRSHPDSDVVNTKIRADLEMVTTNDGHYYAPAQGLIFDKATTGSIGGMQAAAVNSTWNKLYYLRKRSDGSEGLWGLRAKNYLSDTSFTTARDASRALRLLTSTATDRLAQGIQFATGGKHEFIDVELVRAGAVSGNIWFSIQADSAGNPSGTPLATTDKYDASRIPTVNTIIRIPFRTPFTASASTQYHLVMEGDYAKSDTVFISWRGVAAGGYANGSGKQYNGSAWSAATGVGDFYFVAYTTQNDTALSAPSGYDQSVQIGWFYIDGSGNIKWFSAENRKVTVSGSAWKVASGVGAEALYDFSAFLPPQGCIVEFSGGNAAGGGNLQVGHIIATDVDNAALIQLIGAASGQSFGATSNSPVVHLHPLFVEYQAGYMMSISNSHDYWVTAFEW